MELIDTILDKMSNIGKAQRKFLMTLFTTIALIRGRVNFRNLSRYSGLCEKTFSRQFRKSFDFVTFNRLAIEAVIPLQSTLIAAMDCSFSEKSGKHTYGLDRFYNSKHARTERGLEISELAVVDVDYNTAYSLSVLQTPASEKKKAQANRIDCYLEHLRRDRSELPSSIQYLVTDGFYTKKRFIDAVLEANLHSIGKLRCDANLRHLYQGQQKRRGRRRRFDGKVNLTDLSRFDLVHHEANQWIYTAIVNSVSLKRNIRIVYLLKQERNKTLTALLFSTDMELCAMQIYRFYKARFQIEFLFRDARQFTGLTQCQARSKEPLDFHFNASMTALNLIRMEDRRLNQNLRNNVTSIASWKIRNFNEHMLKRFSYMLGLDFTLIKSYPHFEQLRNCGTIGA